MGKVIEFKVDVVKVGVGSKETKVFKAKSLDRLLKSMPKTLKKKWETITFVDENGTHQEVDRSYLSN